MRISIESVGTLIFGLIAHLSLQGQDTEIASHVNKLMPKPVPAAPNVAGLGRYGDYQVNLFHGIPEIAIPIFEAKSGSLTVPITLSYHSSGIKPTDVASWVGLGWSLSAGGMVTRTVQGKNDEDHYYGNALLPNPSVCESYYYLKYAATGVTDTEPDLFSYSFGGRSGKFILPHGANPILYPYAPIKLSTTVGLSRFEITDEQGVLHRFGRNAEGTGAALDATTATNGGNPAFSAVTAWHLLDMVAPNSDDRIDFTYQSLGSSSTHDVSHVYTVKDQCYAANGATCPPSFNYQPQTQNLDSYATQQGLETIVFENGKVEFVIGPPRQDVSTTLARLAEIKIWSLQNGAYQFEKSVEFIFSYFTNANGGNQALKLDELRFKDKNQAVVQRYQFDYFTNQFSWNPQETNFLNARDLWGYYNGAIQNTDLVVPTTIPYAETTSSLAVNITFGGGLNRAVNPTYAKEGVLKRIIFPTGGYTEFDYESNQYSNNGSPTLAGGLRVSQIKSYDGVSATPVTKTYKYGFNEDGLGRENFRDTDFNYSSTMRYYSGCLVKDPHLEFQIRNYYSTSFGGEAPVLYPQVTEYLGDPQNGNQGKTVYVFDSGLPAMDVVHTIPASTKKYTNSNSWRRGKLTAKRTYDLAGNIVSATVFQYSTFMEANNLVGYGVYQFWDPNPSTCTANFCMNESNEPVHTQTFMVGTIYQNSGAVVQTNAAETLFVDGDIAKVFTKQKQFVVNPETLQVLRTTETKSENEEQIITVNKYPFQFLPPSSSSGNALGIFMLNQKNIINTPIETYSLLQQPGGINPRIISGQITTFRASEANNNHVVVDKVLLLESAHPIPAGNYEEMYIDGSNSGVVVGSRYQERIAMNQYDVAGNLLSVSKRNDASITYLYNSQKTFPIAEAINAGHSEIFFESFEEATGAAIVTDETLSHSGMRYKEGDYTVPFTLPNGKDYIIEYWYKDAGNQWQYMAKVYSGGGMSLTEGSAIDDVRVFPRGAFIKTYTYHPINGMNGKVDEKGQTYKYQYDAFGRLYRIINENGDIEQQYTYHYKGN